MRKALGLWLGAWVAGAFSGCNAGGVNAFCGDLPQARGEVSAFRTKIVSYVPSRTSGGRRIASVSEEPSEETRLDWLDWTEKALKKTQWARDAIEQERGTRRALSALSDATFSLVSVHGYIEQRKWSKASSELEKVDRHLQHASELLCTEKAQAKIAAAAKVEEQARAEKDRKPASAAKDLRPASAKKSRTRKKSGKAGK